MLHFFISKMMGLNCSPEKSKSYSTKGENSYGIEISKHERTKAREFYCSIPPLVLAICAGAEGGVRGMLCVSR